MRRRKCCIGRWDACLWWNGAMSGRCWDIWDGRRSWRRGRGACGTNTSGSRAGGELRGPVSRKCRNPEATEAGNEKALTTKDTKDHEGNTTDTRDFGSERRMK